MKTHPPIDDAFAEYEKGTFIKHAKPSRREAARFSSSVSGHPKRVACLRSSRWIDSISD